MTKYKVEYTSKQIGKTSVNIFDFNNRNKQQLEFYISQVLKGLTGFKKPVIKKGDIKFRYKAIKEDK